MSNTTILVDTGSGPVPKELLSFMEETGLKFKITAIFPSHGSSITEEGKKKLEKMIQGIV